MKMEMEAADGDLAEMTLTTRTGHLYAKVQCYREDDQMIVKWMHPSVGVSESRINYTKPIAASAAGIAEEIMEMNPPRDIRSN